MIPSKIQIYQDCIALFKSFEENIGWADDSCDFAPTASELAARELVKQDLKTLIHMYELWQNT